MYYIHDPEYASDCLPGFKQEAKHLLSKILFGAPLHYDIPGRYAFPRSFFKAEGHSKDTFYRINDRLNLFEPCGGSYAGAFPWCETENAERLREEYPPAPLWENNRRAVLKPQRVGGLSLPPAVAISTPALFIYDGWKSLEANNAFWRSQANKIHRVSANTTKPGHLPTKYRQGQHGRVFGVGLNIQNQKKELRSALLAGQFNYDFQNAFFSIAAQLGHYPAFAEYAEAPQAVRESLARELGCTPKSVKQALLALMNGATPYGPALRDTLGASVWAFYNHAFVRRLRQDAKALRKDLGCSVLGNRLMREEHRCLVAATEGVPISVPLFDGFATPQDLEPEWLESQINEKTGYTLKITKADYGFSRSE
ncbi:hypothetical protein [Thioalkalivibrio sp. ALMg11]|uniref:hypothetical protein n=1 Tax=Thioalkalivibrio sp. ALMg11 TaxID=1158165 RepID=UPI0003737537|nr:hypothetical protein [Thioalkalivibrio sp. ALMg11]